MKVEFKKLMPHGIAIGLFLLLTVIYFLPLFEGKGLEQHDIAQWTGMSKELTDFREKYHTEPLWTNAMFSGMPAYQISTLYPANLIQYVNDLLFFFLPSPASYIFLAMLSFYVLMLVLKFDYRMGIAGAIAFAFSSYNFVILIAGHNSKAHAIALMPLVFAGIILTYRGRILFGGALTALALSLELYANHLQITYYLMLTILVMVIAYFIDAIRKKNIAAFIKQSAILAVAAIIGILPNYTSLAATYEYGQYSTRGPSELTEKKESSGLDKDYAFSYSYGISETFTLIIPRFHGGASVGALDENSATYNAFISSGVPVQQAKSLIQNVPLYFGNMISTSGPPYAGALICFLFVAALFIVKGKEKWWLLAATVLSFMLSWGENFLSFNEWFFYHFPGYNKFRAVSMILTIAQFTMPLLALLALKEIYDGKSNKNEILRALKLSLYITGGFCLLFTLLPGLFNDFISHSDDQLKQYGWPVDAIRQDRESALRMDAFRSLFFIAAGFMVMWFTLKGKLKTVASVIIIAALFTVDLWSVGKRYLNDNSFTTKNKTIKPFEPSQANLQILQDTTPGYRVLNTTLNAFSDASTSYFHRSIGGYHGAKLKRYQELIEQCISKNNMSVLDMLNTKYFIVNDKDRQPMAQINPGAMGAAWFVDTLKMVANADEEIKSLDSFNPKHTAFVDVRFEPVLKDFKPSPDSTASIQLKSIVCNHLVYESQTTQPQFCVFSEIYYDKGWNAYIDGQKADHVRANYVLRAMIVPSGKHTIEFKFEPEVYATGEKISLAGSIILLLLFAAGAWKEIKSGKN
jgi:hypothetical protein